MGRLFGSGTWDTISLSSKVFTSQLASKSTRFLRHEMDIIGTNVLRSLLGQVKKGGLLKQLNTKEVKSSPLHGIKWDLAIFHDFIAHLKARSKRTENRHVMLPNSGIYRPEEVILIILCDLLIWWTRTLDGATLSMEDLSQGTVTSTKCQLRPNYKAMNSNFMAPIEPKMFSGEPLANGGWGWQE